MEINVIIIGFGGEKILRVLVQNAKGAFHENEIPVGTGALDLLETALTWVGKTVTLTVEKGEIEAFKLVE